MTTAAIYASFYPGLKQVAEQHGYALAIHGSLNRDFDLVAIPWTEDAADSETLARALKDRIGGDFSSCDTLPIIRPHGRHCWPIWLDGSLYIDLAIMVREQDQKLYEALDQIADFDCTGGTNDYCNGCPSCIARQTLGG